MPAKEVPQTIDQRYSNWRNTSMADICTFVGINILMGMKRLPSQGSI